MLNVKLIYNTTQKTFYFGSATNGFGIFMENDTDKLYYANVITQQQEIYHIGGKTNFEEVLNEAITYYRKFKGLLL